MKTTYEQRELLKAEDKHDWTCYMSLQLSGSEFSSRWISVNQDQYKKLLEIFKSNEQYVKQDATNASNPQQ